MFKKKVLQGKSRGVRSRSVSVRSGNRGVRSRSILFMRLVIANIKSTPAACDLNSSFST